MIPSIQLKKTTSVFLLALACFVFLPQIQAAPDALPPPPPDGCYPGFTTAEGCNALAGLGSGVGNTGFGWHALSSVGGANFNTALGAGALVLNTGDSNTAVGTVALLLNTTGDENTAVGTDALVHNVAGNSNTAVGALALESNTTISGASGISNNAIGRSALNSNTTGSFNQAIGVNALLRNTTGSANIAIGDDAGTNITGSGNVTVGTGSFTTGTGITSGSNNTVVGDGSGIGITSASGNTILGNNSATNPATGNNNVYVGKNVPGAAESNTIRIADPSAGSFAATNCFIGGIFNVVPLAGSHLASIGPGGQLADATASSRRFKKDITPIDKISEGVLALKPVTFHYKNDNTNEPEFGLVAEDVAEVNADWITRDREGEIFGVRYEVIPILLLNEFLKEHKKVEEQQASISQLKSEMQTMVAQLREQAAQIQKVSAQLEVSKPAPQVVTNKP